MTDDFPRDRSANPADTDDDLHEPADAVDSDETPTSSGDDSGGPADLLGDDHDDSMSRDDLDDEEVGI